MSVRHLKVSTDKSDIKKFVCDNAEYLILGGVVIVGMIVGKLFAENISLNSFLLYHSPSYSFTALFLESFWDITIYIFLIFFCGTSSVGFISPLVLLFRGFLIGSSAGLSPIEGFWAEYMLCFLPYSVLTSALLIYLCKNNIVISLRLFRMCSGSGSADVPVIFRRFAVVCLISLAIAAIVCLIYSLMMTFVVPLFL